MGIQISEGQINNILADEANNFKEEKESILEAAKKMDSLATDDTAGRNKKKNVYTTVIGSDLFAYFKTTESKSRISFLKTFRGKREDYLINEIAFEYLDAHKVSKILKQLILNFNNHRLNNDIELEKFFIEYSITNKHDKRILTEAMLLAIVIESGWSKDLNLHSDDAGQFKLFIHGLCWIHAVRTIERFIPIDEHEENEIKNIFTLIWQYYQDLKDYKLNPNSVKKIELSQKFDDIFNTEVNSLRLKKALIKFIENKEELLRVLENPKLPLHNNDSENSIRHVVMKRNVSNGTRSDAGKDARDVFISLKVTCRKLRIPFFEYLKDRINKTNSIPRLTSIILEKSQALAPPS